MRVNLKTEQLRVSQVRLPQMFKRRSQRIPRPTVAAGFIAKNW